MAMATLPTSSISPPSTPLAYPTISVVPLSPTSLRLLKFPRLLSPIPTTSSLSSPYALPAKSTTPAAAAAETAEEEEMRTKGEEEESMSISNLKSFVVLNLGTWSGTFYQFDANGNFRHRIRTRLAAGSYGEDELISLIQTLYIKQPPSSTSVSGEDEEPEWAEYKIKESNMFTVDKYQQICFFPNERAFALRYQTAGMLETVLRQGVLGEDDTGEESPRNLKLPSRRPSIVCENCLYSLGKDTRARAFHIMDPKGILEMLLIFLEEKATGTQTVPSLEDSKDNESRITPFLGRWKGHSVTKRSGVYGATIAEHDTLATLEIDEQGQLLQVITSTSKEDNITTNVPWTGCILQNVVIFDEGFQFTLLPGGMYMGYPSDVAKSVAESRSFHLEFCWIDSSSRRQRLIRTFDAEGYAVSSTYYLETMI